ncbi:conserved hypothetical protein [Desulfamplus magnetovallimortis]|uniref:Uncharacterized protein n=1 Tax=Desulfamplus magnetovallimortis TaxID=1246637 RepID=A0A1W1H8K4_9BACT|nr:hypothetical protein [Desulfamplus magnetovallimortis]SLM28792.1 conserved hypothetical protein [Desulfamplus magnetovallimortis]
MARSARDMADQLIKIYSETKKRYLLTKDEFKSIAGKFNLKEAYLWEVDSFLREDGYLLVDLRSEEDSIGVIKIRRIKKQWKSLSEEIVEEYEFDDWDEED